jgi:hypothetical protein
MGVEQPGTGGEQAGQQQYDGQAPATGAPGGQEQPGTGAGDLAAELAKWKDLARQNEARAKANADAAKRLAAIEESGKTEQQKLADRLQQAEQRAAAAESQVLRSEVATAKGVPAALAGRLQGSTREELEADADDLLSHLPTAPPGAGAKVPPVDAVAGTAGGHGPRTAADEFASFLGA